MVTSCPDCQGELAAEVDSTEIRDINDEFAQIKVKKILEKLGEEELRKIIDQLKWEQPQNDQQWEEVLLKKSIVDGKLNCSKCKKEYKIIRRLPIFVDE